MNSRINLIVLDSNFILLPFQFKIDYFDEIRTNIEGKLRFIIFQQILDELESKRKKEPETSNFTRFFESGLLYLEKNKEKYNIQLLEDVKNRNETTDDFLLRVIKNLKKENIKVYLATNDSELRK